MQVVIRREALALRRQRERCGACEEPDRVCCESPGPLERLFQHERAARAARLLARLKPGHSAPGDRPPGRGLFLRRDPGDHQVGHHQGQQVFGGRPRQVALTWRAVLIEIGNWTVVHLRSRVRGEASGVGLESPSPPSISSEMGRLSTTVCTWIASRPSTPPGCRWRYICPSEVLERLDQRPQRDNGWPVWQKSRTTASVSATGLNWGGSAGSAASRVGVRPFPGGPSQAT